LIYTEIFL